jgi:C-terminal processing protease CtpA/Prc
MRPMRKALPAAAIVVVLSALAGGMFGSKVAARQDRANERYRMYLAALDAIQNDYVESLDQQQLVYGSIDGMLRTLDPHSAFLDPRSFAQMRERQVGAYFGIGISILSIDGEITVISLFEGSTRRESAATTSSPKSVRKRRSRGGPIRASRPRKSSGASKDRGAPPSISPSGGRASTS